MELLNSLEVYCSERNGSHLSYDSKRAITSDQRRKIHYNPKFEHY